LSFENIYLTFRFDRQTQRAIYQCMK